MNHALNSSLLMKLIYIILRLQQLTQFFLKSIIKACIVYYNYTQFILNSVFM